MTDISDLRSTIVPKGDQLNTDQLLGGQLTITVTKVEAGSEEQPLLLHYDGEQGRPYKPGKTMRKLLIYAWGEDGRQWVGRSMTLFADSAVMFGGMKVGGIRISHLSDIAKPITIALTSTKGKKAQHSVEVLQVVTLAEVLKAISGATNKASMDKAKAMAVALISEADKVVARTAYQERVQALKKGSGTVAAPAPAAAPAEPTGEADAPAEITLESLQKRLAEAPDAEKATAVLDDSMKLSQEDQQTMINAFNLRFP